MYRWGNPQAYKRGNESDKLLFGQHNSHWIPEGLPDAGKILIFNNGRDRPDGDYTTVVKIDPTVLGDGTYAKNSDGSFLPETYFYEYTSPVPTDFYSWFISGAQQLSSGNLLINDGAHGTFFEINESEEIVWKYINPVVPMGPLEQGQLPINQNDEPNNGVFRATKYEKDYAAFNGRTLTPGDFVQLDPQEVLGGLDNTEVDLLVYPNPGSNIIHIKGYSSKEPLTIELFQIDGKVLQHQSFIRETTIDVSGYQSGTYFIRVNKTSTQKLILN